MTASPATRLRDLGLTLPDVPRPAGRYVHAARSGQLLFLAGKGPTGVSGKLGRDFTVTQGYEYARLTALQLVAVLDRELGSLDKVARIVKVSGFVNAVPEFADHPAVIDGCSDLLVAVFGKRGEHARTAIGVSSTPFQIPVEIDLVVECDSGA